MLAKIGCLLIVLSTSLFAQENFKENFCQLRLNRSSFKEYILNPAQMMGFENQGGAFNQGVCWWHSRFQRNSYYLTQMDPSSPRPNENEVLRLIKKIRSAQEIIIIPGFETFNEFTKAYEKEIQRELNRWQIYDGAIRQSWVEGISNRVIQTPVKLKKMMDELFSYVNQGKIAYEKLQLKGIPAHAWLVVDMLKTLNGYELQVVDSNSADEIYSVSYQEGDNSLYTPRYGNFTPYLRQENEEAKLQNIVKKYCQN